MMSQKHMLGVISRPKSSLESAPLLCNAANITEESFYDVFLLVLSVSHQSHWMELRPLAVSSARQRYCRSRWPLSCGRLQVIWHLSLSHLLRDAWAADSERVRASCAHMACVCKWDRVRKKEREVAVPHYTYDGSVGGGGEKWTNQLLQW